MGNILSVGIIGAGGIAHAHMNAIEQNDNIKLAAIMDIDTKRLEEAQKRFGGRIYTKLEDILKDPEVEAVHVCTPHNVHGEHVVASARAGKHVLVKSRWH